MTVYTFRATGMRISAKRVSRGNVGFEGLLQICDADALRTCLRAQKGSPLLRPTGMESVHQQHIVAPAGDLIKSDKLHRYPVTPSSRRPAICPSGCDPNSLPGRVVRSQNYFGT